MHSVPVYIVRWHEVNQDHNVLKSIPIRNVCDVEIIVTAYRWHFPTQSALILLLAVLYIDGREMMEVNR